MFFLQLVFQKDVHIRFQLLDIAPLRGDVLKYPSEIPLDKAAKRFITAVKGNSLIIQYESAEGVS